MIAPNGFDLTEKDALGNSADGIDSDFNVDTAMTDNIDLAEGEQSLTVAAGLVANAPIGCNILGSDSVTEGLRYGEEYQVQLDQAVTEDTLVTIRINSDTAQQTDGTGYKTFIAYWGGWSGYGQTYNVLKNEDVIYYTTNQAHQDQVAVDFLNDPSYSAKYATNGIAGSPQDQIVGVNNLTKDFLVFDADGNVVTDDTVTVLVRAGEKTSEKITIKANREVEVGADLARSLRDDVREENETFSLSIDSIGNHIAEDCELDIAIYDYYANVSPIVFDLNSDGAIGVTGESTAKDKDTNAELGQTVEFDIDADGDLDTIEWVDGSGDGILVDTTLIGSDGSINGSALFGDEGRKYTNGYEKLALHDANGDGEISGDELESLGLWVDDGDAILETGELHSAKEMGIASISSDMKIVLDSEGRELMQSTATTIDGQTILTEDVWFASVTEDVSAIEADESVLQAEVEFATTEHYDMA
ncbi:MAG: hypothetical protein ACKE51_01185 [Methylococcaceae bacterium]